MMWERTDVIGLARVNCKFCHGYGMRPVRKGMVVPCDCVFRAIFRACFRRFRECITMEHRAGSATFERCGSPEEGYRLYSRKLEEYIADFCLIAQRNIEEPLDKRLFRYHYLLGADSEQCCRHFQIDLGLYFHAIYRIESRLGRAFADVEPYPLYPVDKYFQDQGVAARRPVVATVEPTPERRKHLVPPLLLSA